ncbi:MAG TPA: hypothetical protein VLS93_12000, partial [Anaeromyxobacteraceae bacterium]|nr:hypothetical protein [Anaeromyxobacteraceae bacterium]
RMARALVAAAVLLPTLAAGAPYDGTQAFDAYTGLVVASGRVVGLGGAYVGVGEGVAGVTVNPASVAQRDRHNADTWDLDGVLTWYLPPPEDLAALDLSNDGVSDAELAGSGSFLLGGSGQAGRLGAGIVAQFWGVASAMPAGDSVTVGKLDLSLAVGWSGRRDSLVLGASVRNDTGSVSWTPLGGTARSVNYQTVALRLGALWRPRGRPFRLGVAWDPGGRAEPLEDRSLLPVTTPAAFEFPWVLSVGASAWIGPNARRYNEPPPIALDRHPDWGEGPPLVTGARMPVLVSIQLDVAGRTPGAVSIESALLAPGEAQLSGERTSLAVKLGAEWEAWPRWVRVRGGGYLEPSRTGAGPRMHATFGLEVRIPFWPWDLQIGATGDVARLYQNVSLSLGFWGDYGPMAPPG